MHDRHIAAVFVGLTILTAALPPCLYAGPQEATVFETQRQSAEAIIMARVKPDALPNLGFAEDSPFGVCGSAFAAEHLDRLGITWARMGVPEFKPEQAETWLETKGETFPFSDAARAVLDAGGRVLGLINFKDTATWVESGHDGYLDVVSECTRRMVEAHKDRIHHWEVVNEPDVFSRGVTPQQMAPIVKAAIRGARQADPDCFLLSPCPTSITYMEALLEEGIGPMVDGFAFHVYSQGGAMPNVLRHWKQLYADFATSADGTTWTTGFLLPLEDAAGPSELIQIDGRWHVFFTRNWQIRSAGIPAGNEGRASANVSGPAWQAATRINLIPTPQELTVSDQFSWRRAHTSWRRPPEPRRASWVTRTAKAPTWPGSVWPRWARR